MRKVDIEEYGITYTEDKYPLFLVIVIHDDNLNILVVCAPDIERAKKSAKQEIMETFPIGSDVSMEVVSLMSMLSQTRMFVHIESIEV